MNRRRPSRVYFFYSGGILEGEGEQQLPRHTPGKMPRFEQIGNLYRCRDAEMAKEVMMVVVVRFESWLGLSLLPSFENVYIFFYVLWILTRSLWRYERRDRTKLGIVSLLVDTDSNALRTELNQPLESFN